MKVKVEGKLLDINNCGAQLLNFCALLSWSSRYVCACDTPYLLLGSREEGICNIYSVTVVNAD